MQKYARQIILPEIGDAGQKKLSAASALCIGAGGLGSPVLLYLAAAGIGRIGIADHDAVDETNLHRQILFANDDIGKSKSAMAQSRLMALNPDIDISSINARIDAKNILDIAGGYDIIIDGSDNLPTKFLINDAAVKLGKPWVYGAVTGFSGQAALFDATHGPCFRCLYPTPPENPPLNCAEAGVIGAVAGIVGATQSLQAIQYIVDVNMPALSGQLWTIDGKTMQTHLFQISKNPQCETCGPHQHQSEKVVMIETPNQCAAIRELTVDQARAKPSAIWIDVREIDEWNAGHVESAMHWALSKLQAGQLPGMARDAEIILYCQRGRRSLVAADIMQKNGFKNLFSLAGGYSAL